MKLSDIRDEIVAIMATEGDIDLGDASEVTLRYGREGWAGGWSTQVISSGLYWQARGGAHAPDHFIGTETVRSRTVPGFYRPADSELSDPITRAVKR